MATQTSPSVETVTTGADKAKLAVAGLLVIGAVVAYYMLGQQDLWLRIVALIALLIVAVGTTDGSTHGEVFGASSRPCDATDAHLFCLQP